MHFDTHFDQWNKGKYVVGDRRIMLTQWVGQAWKEFHEDSFDVIRRAFRKLGLSLTIDGSEDDQLHGVIKIKIMSYTIEKTRFFKI